MTKNPSVAVPAVEPRPLEGNRTDRSDGDTSPKQTRYSKWSGWLAPLTITTVGGLVYLNSFEGAFLFDDRVLIVDNTYIRHLWPPWASMFGRSQIDRPLIGLSNAINYAISGLNVWSYHALNLMIHVLAALALFGIVRRTLLKQPEEHLATNSTALALTIALVWMVHPLQTAAVTYVAQRCESMMGMLYLATLYFAIRGLDSKRNRRWFTAAIVVCLAGMLCKQVMVTAPLVVLLYDLLFVSGSLRVIRSQRKWFYIGLAATWIPLAATVALSPANTSAGFGTKDMTPLRYLLSEFHVIVHYLRLSFWPDSLCLDYVWPPARRIGEILPYGIVVGASAVIGLWSFVRRARLSFTAIWFFLVLSVTSSIMPFSDLAFDHRMYLPLAGIVTLVVLASYSFGRRLAVAARGRQAGLGRSIALAVSALVVGLLGFATIRRNVDYKSGLVMWSDVVSKRPNNPRAENNLGMALLRAGKIKLAEACFTRASELGPALADPHLNLGLTLLQAGDLDGAMSHLLFAVNAAPRSSTAQYSLGLCFAARGDASQAESQFRQALQIDPNNASAHFHLGLLLEGQGKTSNAVSEFRIALRLNPDLPDLLEYLRDHPLKLAS